MRYKQYIICNTSFGKTLGLFLCNRPDKRTIIYEHCGNLHEIDKELVEPANLEFITQFLDKKIDWARKINNSRIHAVNECEKKIHMAKEKLSVKIPIIHELNDKLESMQVIEKLGDADDLRDQIIELENDIEDKLSEKYAIQEAIYTFEEQMRSHQNDADKTEQELQKWESQKNSVIVKKGFCYEN